jgi:phospholipase/lecithinase/hemolysin
MRLRPVVRRTLGLLALTASAAGAQSRSFVFFGDSFVDAGNAARLVAGGGGTFPYPSGRFSDGPVWSEILASAFGTPNSGVASLAGGQNYAIGGATTGTLNVVFGSGFGLLNQVSTYAGTSPVPAAGRIAVLFAGGNDFINAGSPNPTLMAQNVLAAATQLRGLGITEFLIPTLPDLSLVPRGLLAPAADRAALSAGIAGYNALVSAQLAGFAQASNATIYRPRFDNLFTSILGAPGAFGFTNTTNPCIDVLIPGTNVLYPKAPSCATAVFFDDLHPTTATHRLVAQVAAASVVPEPATVVLVGAGVISLACAGALRRRAA